MGLFGKRSRSSENWDMVESMVGENSYFKGEIHAKGSVHLGGRVVGKIDSEADVYVAEKSMVKGDISASQVFVAGEVEGHVVAAMGLEISKTGRVMGDLSTGKLTIEDGAVYTGKVSIGDFSRPAKKATDESIADSAEIYEMVKKN